MIIIIVMYQINKYVMMLNKYTLIMIMVLFLLLLYFKNILSLINTQRIEMSIKKTAKIVVFDLDETLGYFTELSMFWDAIEHYYGHNLTDEHFFSVIDLFPECLRPDIINILKFIHDKKNKNLCNQIIIYTNNQGPKKWVETISKYFDRQLGHVVFDTIIAAYKINGKVIEPNRTTHEKSVLDLIKCTNISVNTEICFIDDLYHPLMNKQNVFYINIKPYRCSLSFDEMATRYYNKEIGKFLSSSINKDSFIKTITNYMKRYNYMVLKKSEIEEKTDKIVSKKLLSYLEEFLQSKKIVMTKKKGNKKLKAMSRVNKKYKKI